MRCNEFAARLFYVILLLPYLAVCAQGASTKQTINSEEKFLKECLNLDYKGLERVKKAVNSENYGKARGEYIHYLKTRTSPVWHFDWRSYSPPSQEEHVQKTYQNIYADRFCDNEMLSHGVWYNFGDTIDWTSNHSTNNYDEWTWQLNRHYAWQTLGSVYWKTGDEKYAKAFVRQMKGWIEQCKMPSSGWNKSGSAWRTFETGLRMQETWPDAFFYFLPSVSFDDESIMQMLKSFYEQAVHLRNHYTSNNFLAVEMNGLFTVSLLFPEFKEADEWRDFAVSTIYEEEKNQFYPDGAQKELAPGYHVLTQSNIVSLYSLSKMNGYKLPDDFISRLESTYDYYVKLRLPDGTLPAINDSRWVDSEKFIKEASAHFPNRKDFLFFAKGGLEGKEPSYKSVWMPWAGWYIMRSGWDEDSFYSFFEVGPFGNSHQHEDKLSFILYAFGNKLITESGIYAYDSSIWRQYTVSARGHNVVRVDGEDQNRRALRNNISILRSQKPLDNVWISNRKHDYGIGQYIEGYGPKQDTTVTHIRSLKFVKNKYWHLTDRFLPSDTLSHTYDTWFHFSTSNYETDSTKNVVYSCATDASNIAIVHLTENSNVNVVVGERGTEIMGWIPVVGGENGFHCEPVATPTYHSSGQGEVTENYIFIPFRKGEKMPIKRVKRVTFRKYRIYLSDGKIFNINIK